MNKFKEYNKLDLAKIHKDILNKWIGSDLFNQSIKNREGCDAFTFYEGPPSANGKPGIHHVIARTIKDIFCRYKTLQGFKVERKAGWDTHGLPVELGVEKKLNITKEDIGSTISIKDYNKACQKNVMKYTDAWEDITKKMGYWVDMKNPYITYDNKYIESVWWLLSEMYKKNLLYKGHTIQPFSPKAGTGLSTHELNQPGCYRSVKDVSVVAQFKVLKDINSNFLFQKTNHDIYFLAWTTTPWTLPSNTALGVGKKIHYVLVDTINQYTGKKITVILAKELFGKYFSQENINLDFTKYTIGDKNIPFKIISEFKGLDLANIKYEQLLKYASPSEGDAFKVILADFVTTEDGTGIVHLAPSFGSDDSIVAKQNNIGSLTLVDKQGRFTKEVYDFAGIYVKEEYYENDEEKPKLSADVQIVIKLKKENLCFRAEKYDHSYPHCWRTDKPILYYPMDSWFIKTTEFKNKMIKLNESINWKPESTGKGRFGNWLENLVDWNLSRSRFWGIPIPIWKTEDGEEEICVGSIEELKSEINKSIKAGIMQKNPLEKFITSDFSEKNYTLFDLHRPYIDNVFLVSKSGKKMKREEDLIDVWFDSGAMPYAQLHYPFENKQLFKQQFPADFIAEGVDQTRGWFFTLHAISVMLFNSIAYKNVISNGLVLDKEGNKMSKRLNNAVDPFTILEKHGADATRWYMITNAQPWDNLKFDEEGISEVKRKFFGTLYNTYAFFALYANIDQFSYKEKAIDLNKRSELDIWIISELNSLIKNVTKSLEDYEPTRAARLIQNFVINRLSNWYVRLSRRRFWKGEYNTDKICAYQTLYECLEKIAIIASPVAPFFMDNLFCDLSSVVNKNNKISVHLADFPKSKENLINTDLEEKMQLAQTISNLSLSLRKKEQIRVRQPLQKILIPVLNSKMKERIESVKNIILSEINVKEIEYLTAESNVLTKKIKPNFKILGPKFGKDIQKITKILAKLNNIEINKFEQEGVIHLENNVKIKISEVEIITSDVPGYIVSGNEHVSVALDVTLSKQLKEEGLAREFVNRIQTLRKENKLEVMDKICLEIMKNEEVERSINNNLTYICDEILADKLTFVNDKDLDFTKINLIDSISASVRIKKC